MKILEIIHEDDKDLQAVITYIKDVICAYSDVAAVYLFGSVLNGRLRVDSDIDIALLPIDKVTISLQFRLKLSALLEKNLGRIVDVGVISPRNLIYASEVIFTGRRIITLQKEYVNTVEMRLLGCYSVFKQDRKEVEENYRAA